MLRLTCTSPSRFAILSGPICDRTDRVTQACRLERIASQHDRRSGRIGDLTDHLCPCPSILRWALLRGREGLFSRRWQDRSVVPDDRNPVAYITPISIVIWIVTYLCCMLRPPRPRATLLGVGVPVAYHPGRSRFQRDCPSHGRGPGPAGGCPPGLARSTLHEPGRRIGQRGDATRAPTRVPRPGWAAGCRPSASRDWPRSDKSIHSL